MTDGAKPSFASRFRPRWAWICLASGLPWLLAPDSFQDRAGCLFALSEAFFWLGLLALLFVGAAWLWKKLLFRVSRRLWVILLLLSFLPAFLLTGLFLSAGWVALGGQVSRTMQANIRVAEAALRRAALEPSDLVATRSVRWTGDVEVVRLDRLPPGVGADFTGLVWNHDAPLKGKGIFLCAVSPDGPGFRVLAVSMGALAEQGKDLWGGRMHYRLGHALRSETNVVAFGKKRSRNPENLGSLAFDQGESEIESWSQGAELKGSGLFAPFRLPPVGLSILDWRSGRRDLLLTARPETSLPELWKGYGFWSGQGGNRSRESFFTLLVIGLVLLLGFCLQMVAMVTGLYLARQLGGAVDDLFVGVGRLASGDFGARIKPRTKDQIGRLAQAFNGMAGAMEQSLAERQKRLALEEELRVAREVQMHLLPDIPVLHHGAAVHATLIPARDVAGDYYDLFRLEDGRLAFLIADVSGKGTSAAFYAAETKGVVAALDKIKRGPREVAQRLNEIWCDGHSRKIFMTLVYGWFDPRDGRFAFVRAGHPAPLLRREDGRVERLNPKGLGIGMSRDRFMEHLELQEGRLQAGECLLFYTDGLSEAQGPDGAYFGDDRVLRTLAASGDEVQRDLLAAVTAFTGEGPIEDDLTLLVLQKA